MKFPDVIVAIDGYSSTGKSSFAKLIAKEYSLLYLDSGALYRAVTLHAMENGMISESGEIDEARLESSVKNLEIGFTHDGAVIGDRLVENEIRTLAVSGHVSPVSAIPFVREYVNDILHKFGKAKRVVMDGRDIGSSVFPEAEMKIFMVANTEVRAQRRFKELQSKGQDPKMEDVLKNITDRDYIDSHRAASPLSMASDAYVLDNSDMTLKEELAWFQGLAQGLFHILR